jgi:hypothetical protein
MIHHMCETWSQHTWWLCSRPGFGPLKPGCDRSGIKGMLTVRRNLDRTGQPLSTYLTLILLYFSWSCLTFYCSTLINLTFATLILSKLLLIYSHLFPLYSDYSYLFFLKTNVDFTLGNPVPKVTFKNRRPNLRNKNKTIFIGIYTLECLFLWYLSDLDLWLSMISGGVMSTIISAYTYRHKNK